MKRTTKLASFGAPFSQRPIFADLGGVIDLPAIDEDYDKDYDEVWEGLHLIEVEATVVDTVKATFEAVILSPHARKQFAALADRNVEGVDSMILTTGDQLGKDDRGFAVKCGIAQVVLIAVAIRSVDHKLFGLGVIGCSRPD